MQTAVVRGRDDVLNCDLVISNQHTFDDQAQDLLLDGEGGLDQLRLDTLAECGYGFGQGLGLANLKEVLPHESCLLLQLVSGAPELLSTDLQLVQFDGPNLIRIQ
jgi:hypothetical protein